LPYAATLDGAAFVPGDYLLRAVATDIHGKTDPAPTAITVTFSEMPDVITDLKAKVNGGTVTLTWSSQASGLTGYVLERYDGQGVVTRIALPAQASVSYPDAELADDHYRYRVSALGASGKSNLASDDVAALVHTPLIEAPFTPTAKASFTLSGHTLAGGTLTLSNRADDGDHSAEFDNGADGSFTLTGLALPMGLSQHSLTHTDALGNVSKAARFDMRRADPPAQPTGLAAQTVGDQTVVSWNANSETDIIGYGVIRNGQAEQDNPRPQWTLVVDPADQTNAYNATDADPTTVWTPNMAGPAAAKTLHMQFNDSVVLSRASLNWAAGGAARDYDLLIPAGAGNWTVLAKVRANGAVANEVRFDSVRVTELRLQILDANGAPALAEFAFSGPHLQPATNLALTPMAHQETFAVYAVNAYGMSGAQASVVHQSSAPQADLAVAAAALVFDTPQPSVGSTVRLHIPLENKGQGAALQFGAAISALGPNGQQVALGGTEITQLDGAASTVLSGEWVPDAAGEWTITVVADSADAVAESDETNNQAVRKVTVGAAVPGAALPLQVSAPAGGAALALSWTAPGALQPAGYRIRAAAAAAGPYSAVGGVVASLDYVDTNVVNGVRRFYIVTAIDALGQVIATSALVSGVAQDRQAPGAPLLLGPTVAGKPVVVESRQVDVVGFAEPGASVALLRGAALIGAAEASSAIAEREFGAIGSHGFDVSADGRRLVLGDDGAVIGLDSGTRTTVPSALRADQLAWSHDGRLLAMFAEEDRQLHVYSVAEDAIILRTTMRNTNFVLAWSPDDQQLLIDGTDDQDQTGLFLIDRNSGAQRLLTAGWNFDGQVSWTPDGQHIAIARDGRIAVLRASDGEQVFAESRFSGAPNWSADGKRLLYEFAAGDVRQIAEFQIDGGAVRDLSDTSADRSKPLWTGIGNDFIYAEDGKAVLRPLDGDARLTIVAERYDSNRAFTTGRGELFYRKDGRLHRMTLAGQFRMANVDLLDGENVFTATAADKAGNVSAAALPISVTHAAGAIADLAASEQDLTVLPAAPLVGEATRLGISVRNIGTAPASAVGVSVTLRSPAGKTSVLHQSVMAQVNAGASEVISLDWTPAETGEYTLALSLDAGATVAESNERNNVALRTIGVAANALPTLAVSTERANYGANAALAGKATLFNPGAQVSGALVLRIEDADGYLVDALPGSDVVLAYGQKLEQPFVWNTGAVLAGNYRVVAELRDTQAAVLVSNRAVFRIDAARDVVATVAVDQAQYHPHQPVAIAGTVTLAGGNAGLDNASARIEVVNSATVVVFDKSETLGSLLPGATVNVDAVFDTGSLAVGTYRVKLSVISAGAAVAGATTDLALVAATQVQLSGKLALSAQSVAAGDRLRAAYTLDNAGVALAAMPLTVSIVDPDTQVRIAQVETSVDLASAASVAGEAGFDVAAWPLKSLQVVLSATLNGKPVVLQRATVRVADRTAPLIAFEEAARNGRIVMNGATPLFVRASDSQSLVAAVEYNIGASSGWSRMAADNLAEGRYRMSVAALGEGARQIQARATDAAGNVSATVQLDIVIDNTAPQIAVSGVADGARYTGPVQAQIVITDPYLVSQAVTLDGAPYVSGTPVASGGSHVLQIDAADQAGNTAARTVRFEIAATAITVAIVEPLPGALLRTPFAIGATASGGNTVISRV
jgi:hypothetical protein